MTYYYISTIIINSLLFSVVITTVLYSRFEHHGQLLKFKELTQILKKLPLLIQIFVKKKQLHKSLFHGENRSISKMGRNKRKGNPKCWNLNLKKKRLSNQINCFASICMHGREKRILISNKVVVKFANHYHYFKYI